MTSTGAVAHTEHILRYICLYLAIHLHDISRARSRIQFISRRCTRIVNASRLLFLQERREG